MKSKKMCLGIILTTMLVFGVVSCDSKTSEPPVVTEEEDTVAQTEKDTEEETEIHIHSYGDWAVVVEPTCTNSGKSARECVCGDEQSEEIPAKGHTETIDVAVAPTCTETGLTEGRSCSVCKKIFEEQKVVETVDHAVTDWVIDKEAEWGVEGSKHGNCSMCGKLLQETIDARYSEGLSYSGKSDGTWAVSGIDKCADSVIYIPPTHEGTPVTAIYESAFRGCKDIVGVVIPDSVTAIETSAFNGCANLSEITIPDSVTNIGDFAFQSCNSLERVTVPNSVTNIGYKAFAECMGLTEIVLSSGMSRLSSELFKDCVNLSEISIPDSVSDLSIDTFLGCENLFQVDGGLTYVGDWVVSCDKKIESVELRESTVGIGGGAFSGCNKLSDIVIPNKVVYINYSAFSNCTALTDITIGEKVEMIGQDAFSGCSGLEEITIPDSVLTISHYAFRGCSNVSEITIPKSVMVIGDAVFSRCSKLANISVEDDNLNFCSVDGVLYTKDLSTLIRCPITKASIDLPDNLTCIDTCAFEGCADLVEILLPNGLTTVEQSAFFGCANLTQITIPQPVTLIDNFAFRDCKKLASVTIPKSLTYIGNEVFTNCSALTDIYYSGTENEWNEIRKESSWDSSLNDYTLHYNATLAE